MHKISSSDSNSKTSGNMMARLLQLRAPVLSRSIQAATVLALLVSTAQAHEHHEDKIPEGEAISPDPLVGSHTA